MTKSLAIIAGKGPLPTKVAHAARNEGYDILVLPIIGQADANFDGFDAIPIRLGAISSTRATILAHGITKLVMVGKVQWPSLAALRPDFDGVKLLSKMMTKGDDNALRLIMCYFAEKDIEIVGADQFMPDRNLPKGFTVGAAPNAAEMALIAQGVLVLSALGPHDVGQSIVLQNGRVLAIEAAEGTDAMIARCLNLLHADDGVACFVKMTKPQQDRQLDTPVMGRATIEAAARAGIGLLAVEAETVLLADEIERIVETCKALDVRLVAIENSGP
jgi:DUF1009 family protein